MRNLERWYNTIKARELQLLTPRLRKDLSRFEEPQIDLPIESRYIWGEVGTGKTVFAAFIWLEYKKQIYLKPPSVPNIVLFIAVSDLFDQFKASFNTKDTDSASLLEIYKTADFLVLDDIGVIKPSDWALQSLYSIINYRYEYLKPTIITANIPLDQLSDRLGDDRIPARIRRMGKVSEKIKRW